MTNPNLEFLRKNHESKRLISLRGGTRSGKSYSAVQFLIELCYKYPNAGMVITIARQTLPALKASTLRDFVEILQSFEAYVEEDHNKTEGTYKLRGNTVEFISLDQPQKLRGRKRDALFLDECNEITAESFRQLSYRTTGFIVLSYNPSDLDGWWYEVEAREDAALIVTTYKDNPHLPKSIIAEIESLKTSSPEDWAVFGLGERGRGKKGRIYRNFTKVEELDFSECSDVCVGIDFGFSQDPTAVVLVGKHNDRVYVDELVYETHLTNTELVERIKPHCEGLRVICDSAEPKSIAELRRGGLNAIGAIKGPDSIRNGIKLLQSKEVLYTRRSKDLERELGSYVWNLDKNERPTEKPIDSFNHLLDALRYSVGFLYKRG